MRAVWRFGYSNLDVIAKLRWPALTTMAVERMVSAKLEACQPERLGVFMRRVLAFGMALAAIPTALLAQKTVTQPGPSATIETYCASCHSGRSPAGRVSLDQLDANQPSRDPETWERIVRQLRARTMPPMGSARPDDHTYESTIAALTGA